MLPEFDLAFDSRDILGECVLWDEQAGLVRWLDIQGKRIWQFDPENGEARLRTFDARLACMALGKDFRSLLIGFEWGLASLDLETGEIRPYCEIESDLPFTRLNDGRCDRHGNFLFGTVDEAKWLPRGAWYRFDAKARLSRLDLPPVAIPNSLCFSPDGLRMYFSDGVSSCIQCCDYEPQTGQIENIRVFAEVPNGHPDGSTVDSEACVWNAEWGNGRVVRYRPDGSIERILPVPVSKPSCVAFGGKDLDTLYVTTASIGLYVDGYEEQAGSLFRIRLEDVRGLPESRWGSYEAAVG